MTQWYLVSTFVSKIAGPGHSYNPENNVIVLSRVDDYSDLDPKRRKSAKAKLEKCGGAELIQLAVLAHEETHAVSRNICMWNTYEHPDRRTEEYVDYKQSGLFRKLGEEGINFRRSGRVSSIYRNSNFGCLFDALNEGVVEKLSREITVAYAERSRWPEDRVSAYKTAVASDQGFSYNLEVSLVNAMVKRLATKNQQSERVCWEALVQALLNGETLENQDVVKLFEESFGPSFLDNLSKLYNTTALPGAREAIKRFKRKYQL